MTARPKMLFVIDYLSGTRGGTEGQLLTLIRGIAGQGLAPQLAALQSTEFARSSPDLACPVSALNIKRVLHVGSLVRLIQFAWWVRRERIQVVPKTISVNRRHPTRLDLRSLRRFTWTTRDALEQFDKLRSVWHLIDVSLFAQVARERSDVTYFHHGLKADVLLNAHLEVIQRRRM